MKKFHGPSLPRFLLKKIDAQIANLGFSRAMKKILSDCQTKPIIHGINEQTDLVLQNQPVIVVANHTAEIDVLVLVATLSPREDIYLVINSSFMDLGKHLNKHLIPVYINYRFTKHKNLILRLNLKLLTLLHKVKNFSQKAGHQENIKNIKQAADKIRQGGLVVMFPSGGSETDRWFCGIGHLIKAVGLKKKPLLVKAYIRGTSSWDYLRFVPGIAKILSPLEVFFAKPRPLNRFLLFPARKITRVLEKEYNLWKNKFS